MWENTKIIFSNNSVLKGRGGLFEPTWLRVKNVLALALAARTAIRYLITGKHLLYKSSALELQCINSLPSILLQDFLVENRIHRSSNYSKICLKQQSSPRTSQYHKHVLLLKCSSFYGMLCWFQLLSHQSTEHFLRSLGDHENVF